MTGPGLYSSPTLKVLSTIADPDRFAAEGARLVTFELLNRSPRRPPFGAKFAEKYGVNALHIYPSGDDWYQYPDLDACLAVVAARTARDAVVSGASMGGYAATTYADAIGAARSIAIAPQYSIRRETVPFEKRWAKQAAAIRFRADEGQVARSCRHYVFYDAKSPDAAHAQLLVEHAPNVTLVNVDGGGHTVAVVLAEAGCLSGITRAILEGEPTSDALQAMIGGNLAKSAHRHLLQSFKTPMAAREPHLRAGLELDPKNLRLHHGLACFLHAAKRPAEALPHFEFVLRRRSSHPQYREEYIAACADAGVPPRQDILDLGRTRETRRALRVQKQAGGAKSRPGTES